MLEVERWRSAGPERSCVLRAPAEAKREQPAVRRSTGTLPKDPGGVCKTAARAEMLQTHTGGHNPVEYVWALHQQPKHAAATAYSGLHARASAFEKMLAGLVCSKQLPAGSQSRMRTQPQQKLETAGQRTFSSTRASRRSYRVFKRTGKGAPRAKRTTQECESELAHNQ